MNRDYIASEYRRMHKRNMFRGGSLERYIPAIRQLVKNHTIESLLDYGCGRATHHAKPFVTNTTLYDPYYEPHSRKPTSTYDLVICTDVMEHVPRPDVVSVLGELIDYADKVLFLAISTRPAKKKFANGENVHVTIMSAEEWDALIDSLNTKGILIIRNYT